MHPDGSIVLVLARALALGGLMSLTGAAVFRCPVFPAGFAGVPRLCLAWRRLGLASVGVAVVGLVGWLVAQSADLADAGGVGGTVAAIPAVLAHTRFGHICVGQAICLVLAGFGVCRSRPALVVGAGSAALVLHGLRTHGAVMGGGFSLVSELVHLGAASVWLGALVPLLLVLRLAGAELGLRAAVRFSWVGIGCVGLLIFSAVGQFYYLVGSLAGLVGTTYGWVVLGKTALFAVLLVCAGLNRMRFTPALASAPVGGRSALARSIMVETGAAVAMVLLAAWLAQLTPAAHMQPDWPFGWRFSTVTIDEDADFRAEVLWAAAAVLVALGLLVGAVFVRRWARWVSALAGVAVMGLAVPHLGLLLVPANPDSFFHSPTGFAVNSIMQGQPLYAADCLSCHGADGRGDGPAAVGLAVPPADLTAAHLWGHSDGELFWWLAHGIAAPDGRMAMPGFAGVLSDTQRWAVIDFIRARNGGYRLQADGRWEAPIAAPGMMLACADGAASLADLLGAPVRLVFGAGAPKPTAGVRSVWVDGSARASAGMCAAADPDVARVYGVVTGRASMAAEQILIDAHGMLARAQPPGALPDWNDPAVLLQVVRDVAAHPVAAAPMGGSMAGMAM